MEIIHAYSRRQAVEDGALVAVEGKTAREAGFRAPVALTAAVFEDCVAWSEDDSERKGGLPQDAEGRLWDVLWMAIQAARRHPGGSRVGFQLYRVPREGRGRKPRLVSLVLDIGPGDDGSAVFTVMQPGED